jgi:hypothetical protein
MTPSEQVRAPESEQAAQIEVSAERLSVNFDQVKRLFSTHNHPRRTSRGTWRRTSFRPGRGRSEFRPMCIRWEDGGQYNTGWRVLRSLAAPGEVPVGVAERRSIRTGQASAVLCEVVETCKVGSDSPRLERNSLPAEPCVEVGQVSTHWPSLKNPVELRRCDADQLSRPAVDNLLLCSPRGRRPIQAACGCSSTGTGDAGRGGYARTASQYRSTEIRDEKSTNPYQSTSRLSTRQPQRRSCSKDQDRWRCHPSWCRCEGRD